jgi:hypothetical protein
VLGTLPDNPHAYELWGVYFYALGRTDIEEGNDANRDPEKSGRDGKSSLS